MKIHSLILGVVAAGCVALPRQSAAQVSADDFNALKDTVQKLSQQVQEMMKLHEQDRKTHEEDQTKIQSLQQQLGETKTVVTNVQQKAEEVAKVQSSYPVVSASPNALHNF